MTASDKRFALLSLSDKEGLSSLAQAFVDAGIHLMATGGTYQALKEADLPVQAVEDFTGVKEMLDGRVKTLHPKIHGGLLADRSKPDHLATMADQAIPNIAFLVVNLYPFAEVVAQDASNFDRAIENIDIGGATLLRSAAKNHASLTVLTDKRDYPLVMEELKAQGKTSLSTRSYLASKVFQLTAHYDQEIANYLAQAKQGQVSDQGQDWPFISQTYDLKASLPYGENSQQKAWFYTDGQASQASVAGAKQLNGKALSFNNIKDADVAINMLADFPDQATAIAIKHMTPCGVGRGDNIHQAFDRCYQADSKSIYGGIVSFNQVVDERLAQSLSKIFLEIIVAPGFTDSALAILTKKKKLRLLEIDLPEKNQARPQQVSVSGGLLIQEPDQSTELDFPLGQKPSQWTYYGEDQYSSDDLQTMAFLMKVVKYVKSNAIVVGAGQMTLGVGGGQPNRVNSAQIALEEMKAKDLETDGKIILASDAFIPMRDTVDLASQYGVDVIVQPGGSIHDDDVIAACQEKGIDLVMTGYRHFKH